MEHTWRILSEEILPEHLGRTQVIKTIWFSVITRDGERSSEIAGRVHLNPDELGSFIEYDTLDLDTKVSWIKSHAGDFYENLNISNLNEGI